jgi:hypothetical protein
MANRPSTRPPAPRRGPLASLSALALIALGLAAWRGASADAARHLAPPPAAADATTPPAPKSTSFRWRAALGSTLGASGDVRAGLGPRGTALRVRLRLTFDVAPFGTAQGRAPLSRAGE